MKPYYKLELLNWQELATLASQYSTNVSEYTAYQYVPFNSASFVSIDHFCKKANLTISHYFVFIIPPSVTDPLATIHKDAAPVSVAINCPFGNLETQNHWFEDAPQTALTIKRRDYTKVQIPFPQEGSVNLGNQEGILIDPEQLKKQSQEYIKDWKPSTTIVFDQPMLLKADVWHSTTNPSSKPRLTLSFRFAEKISFEELVSRAGLEPAT